MCRACVVYRKKTQSRALRRNLSSPLRHVGTLLSKRDKHVQDKKRNKARNEW